MHIRIFVYLCAPKTVAPLMGRRGCGEIWLLATTLKNAKILKNRPSDSDDRFHINVLCFVTAPHFCGAFIMSSKRGT